MKPGPDGPLWYGAMAAAAIELVGAAVVVATVAVVWWLW